MATKAKREAVERSKATAAMSQMSDAELAEAAMPHWAQLGRVLPRLGEADVRRLLDWELSHRRNEAVAVRLHQRWTALRARRERARMLATGEAPPLS